MVVHALAQPANRLSLLATDMEEELPVSGDSRFQMIREAAQDWGRLARSYNPSDVISSPDSELSRVCELAGLLRGWEVALEVADSGAAGGSSAEIRVSRRLSLAMLNYAAAVPVTAQSAAISFKRPFNKATAILQFEVLSPVADEQTPDRLARRVIGELLPGWDPADGPGLRLRCREISGIWGYEQ